MQVKCKQDAHVCMMNQPLSEYRSETLQMFLLSKRAIKILQTFDNCLSLTKPASALSFNIVPTILNAERSKCDSVLTMCCLRLLSCSSRSIFSRSTSSPSSGRMTSSLGGSSCSSWGILVGDMKPSGGKFIWYKQKPFLSWLEKNVPLFTLGNGDKC